LLELERWSSKREIGTRNEDPHRIAPDPCEVLSAVEIKIANNHPVWVVPAPWALEPPGSREFESDDLKAISRDKKALRGRCTETMRLAVRIFGVRDETV